MRKAHSKNPFLVKNLIDHRYKRAMRCPFTSSWAARISKHNYSIQTHPLPPIWQPSPNYPAHVERPWSVSPCWQPCKQGAARSLTDWKSLLPVDYSNPIQMESSLCRNPRFITLAYKFNSFIWRRETSHSYRCNLRRCSSKRGDAWDSRVELGRNTIHPKPWDREQYISYFDLYTVNSHFSTVPNASIDHFLWPSRVFYSILCHSHSYLSLVADLLTTISLSSVLRAFLPQSVQSSTILANIAFPLHFKIKVPLRARCPVY